jgi:hypothetical protein
MAKQKSIIKLEGTIGDITFLKTKDGYIAKERTSVNKDRIATDPAFQRTRENGAEFGRAGKAGKTLRSAFRTLLQNTADSKMISRLTAEMMKVIKADTTNDRGLRNVIDGEAGLLEGFEFNIAAQLGSTFFAPIEASITRSNGELSIVVPSFIPINMIGQPSGATHFQAVGAGAEIDFENESYVIDSSDSGTYPIYANPLNFSLSMNITPASAHPVFLVFGIEFYQEVNGKMYSLKNGAYNALQIIKVSAP